MPAAIGLDWGTSSLRAMLFDASGAVHEERSRPWGIRQLPEGDFERAFATLCSGWPRCPVIASGMVGSRQGWHEAAYVDAPAGVAELASHLASFITASGREVSIVPGVRDAAVPDVMRGEETEIIGALALQPELAAAAQIVLPGTHSKWVDIREGRITGFRTVMTGELYAVLSQHSILGAMFAAEPQAATQWAAFDAGVAAARDSGNAGALTRLFSARALVLESRLDARAAPSYLSGLLIGEEWRAMLASGRLQPGRAPWLVGAAQQCALYQRAAGAFGLPPAQALSGAAARGLWQIHLARTPATADAPSSMQGHA